MSYLPTRARERDHERPEDIDRPVEPTAEQDEHDSLSFERMCKAAGHGARLRELRALHEQNRLLAESLRKAEEAADPQARAERIADGEPEPADAEWLAGQAEEQGEER